MDELEHEYTDEITCPYCGYIYSDSWEQAEEAEHNCPECDGKFKHQREIEITYSTYKIE